MAPKANVKLDFSRRHLGNDMRQLNAEIPSGELPYEELDFSINGLSSRDMEAVLDVCRRCPRLRVLKLFKNRIDDVGAQALAELCRAVPGIEEMHLSHNEFTAAGVKTMVKAGEETRLPDAIPLWLRVEQNCVVDPDSEFRKMQSKFSVCKRVDLQACTVRACVRNCKVHLPHFNLQRTQRGDHYDQANGASERLPAPPKPDRRDRTATSEGAESGWSTRTGESKGSGKGFGKGKYDQRQLDYGKQEQRHTDHQRQPDYGKHEQRQRGMKAWGYGYDSSYQEVQPEATGYDDMMPHSPEVSHKVEFCPKVEGNRVMQHQIVDGADASALICSLCHYVMSVPCMTRCSHLFCSDCFQSWVQAKVMEHKKGPNSHRPMPGMPCPSCNESLKKADILPLDQAQGPAAMLLQRRWRNIQLRCIHHPDHFQFAFAKDSEQLSRKAGIECHWIGDQKSYESHLLECTVERELASITSGVPSDFANSMGKVEPFAEPEPVNLSGSLEEDDVCIVKYDFYSGGCPSMLSLKANDVVKIYDTMPTGWAAGIRLDSFMEEDGDPGWFPIRYLQRIQKPACMR